MTIPTTREGPSRQPPDTDSYDLSGPQSNAVTEVPAVRVFEVLGSSPRGLTSVEAAARQASTGPNELPRPQPRRVWRRFLTQFTDLFAVVLLVAAGITMLAYLLGSPRDVGNLQLALAILAVVLLNAVIGFAQEYSAERTA